MLRRSIKLLRLVVQRQNCYIFLSKGSNLHDMRVKTDPLINSENAKILVKLNTVKPATMLRKFEIYCL